MRPNCPRCLKGPPIKNGYVLNKRRWKCRFCRYEYTKVVVQGRSDNYKRQVATLYEVGHSSQSIAKLLHISTASVMQWARKWAQPTSRVHSLNPAQITKRFKTMKLILNQL